MAAREHVDPHALDDHLDQSRRPSRRDYPTVRRPVRLHGRLPPTGPRRAGATAAPKTKPPMWAKKATPPVVAGDAPSDAEAVEQLEHEPEAQDDDRRDLDELVEEARGRRAT